MRTICLFSGDITRCGGTEKVAIELANHLVSTKKFRVLFVSLFEMQAEPYFKMNTEINRAVLFGHSVSLKLCLMPAIIKLYKLLRKEQVDVLIDIDIILSILSIPATKLAHCESIGWEHFHFRENLGCWMRDIGRRLSKRYAKAIVVLTDRDKEQYQETKSHAEIIRIYNCIPEELECNTELLQYSYTESPYIISVGRLSHQKNFELIPRLAKPFFLKHQNWKWLIIGEGENRLELELEIAKYALQNHVILVGRVNPFPYYRKAKFLVMTSRYEGFPLVLLEALSQHCPVISFDCLTGPADIIKEGVNGFLIPNQNVDLMQEKIMELANSSLQQKLSTQALASINSFQKHAIFEQWENLLE